MHRKTLAEQSFDYCTEVKKNNSPIVLDHIQVADLESIMERTVKSGKIPINQPTIEAEL